MARIGKSYPRFRPGEQPELPAAGQERGSGFQVLGAVIGFLAALALIGFLLTR